MLVRMLDQGINALRINLALDIPREQQAQGLQNYKQILNERPTFNGAVLMDTVGLQFRIGNMQAAKSVQLTADQSLRIYPDENLEGTEAVIGCNCSALT